MSSDLQREDSCLFHKALYPVSDLKVKDTQKTDGEITAWGYFQKMALKMDKTLFMSEPLLGLFFLCAHMSFLQGKQKIKIKKQKQKLLWSYTEATQVKVPWICCGARLKTAKKFKRGEKGRKKQTPGVLAARKRLCTLGLSRREKKLAQQRQHSTWQQSSRRRGNETDPYAAPLYPHVALSNIPN